MSNTPQEAALDRFLQTHPEACEISFRAGWYAGEHHERFVRTAKGYVQSKGAAHHSWNKELTEKYIQAKALVLKGFTKREACKMVGLVYDTCLRRQRIEMLEQENFE